MGESGAASHAADLVSVVGGVLVGLFTGTILAGDKRR
jgi:hypothetical protein